MKIVAWLAVVALAILALALGALTLGAFATLNTDSPLLLRSIGTLSASTLAQVGLERAAPLDRALILTGVTGLVAALAAYIKPRS
ncbi:hypothetical protein HNQ07_003722 [Deinococcus metalli]|uniref:Uncharacterized protein n=1 Tax=Deinococcus metalli TaxID=1141878 RepID=A0A7W8KHE0_9DEIO|nr:hypothetical protein [Deinococcus metalli]MBB5378221.1 hypothetical protein [Deinococcus metalli]GHF56937.1 hypothetical protein GCM10017781_36600 [Deinococcus metalli]